MNKLTIIKIGGNVLDNPSLLQSVLDSFAAMEGNKILIHGGGKIANVLMKELGIEPKMVDGRRITDEKTLEIVTQVYAGLINKNLVSQLQARGCNAIGLTGADANTIPAVKRPVKTIDYGFVGDIDTSKINANTISGLLKQGLVPVFAPITHDTKGNLLNTNADTIASSVAIALAGMYSVKLIYCFEKNGVLSNPDDDTTVIPEITEKTFVGYKEQGVIHSGMIPKLDNAYAALKAGVASIVICGPEAFKSANAIPGTTIVL
ncbi:MAG: acetylglutamate kinase [Bacteroidota bacterium]|nr:acetylglutamate kinase [Bacteroidota bacterium]